MSNLFLVLSFSSADIVFNNTTMGASATVLWPIDTACSLLSKLIACPCCSLVAWSQILLVRIESAPVIHLSLKFFLCIIRNRNLLHTEHLSFLTTFVPPSTALSHSSHETVPNSRSKSRRHFSNVVYATFLFFSWEARSYCSSVLASL